MLPLCGSRCCDAISVKDRHRWFDDRYCETTPLMMLIHIRGLAQTLERPLFRKTKSQSNEALCELGVSHKHFRGRSRAP